MRMLKLLLCALMLVAPVFANETDDRQTATSLKYVAHELDTRQDKLSAGQNVAIEYTDSAGDVEQRTVESNLTGANDSLPTVSAVTDGLNTKQDSIDPIDDHTAVTYTGQVGGISTKGIYQTSGTYAEQSNNLIDAKTFNAALKTGLDSEFICSPNRSPDDECWLWEIHNIVTTDGVLPNGYTPLEYIESTATGEQKIVTSIRAHDGLSIEVTLQGTGDRGVVFGFDQDWAGTGIITYGTSYFIASGAGFPATLNKKSTYVYSLSGSSGNWSATLRYNNQETPPFNFTRGGMYALNIFAGPQFGHPNSYWIGKIYSVIVRDGSTITNNFVPARDSGGVVGMYDTVWQRFYANSNTNGEPFVGGPSDFSTNIYIPQNQQ